MCVGIGTHMSLVPCFPCMAACSAPDAATRCKSWRSFSTSPAWLFDGSEFITGILVKHCYAFEGTPPMFAPPLALRSLHTPGVLESEISDERWIQCGRAIVEMVPLHRGRVIRPCCSLGLSRILDESRYERSEGNSCLKYTLVLSIWFSGTML